jgi:thymidylate synthase
MYTNWIYDTVDEALPSLAGFIMARGEVFGSRAGTTKDVTNIGITLTEPWAREITLADRKHNLAAQIAETMWVLSGRNDVAWLERYLPRARDFSDNGVVWRGAYGKRLRRWPLRSDDDHTSYVDQLAHVVDLLSKDLNTRRAVMGIYDPVVDCADGKDIPCNNMLSFSCRGGKLDLAVTIRSNDLMWGWSGINAFEWSVLQEIVAELVGVEVGSLHFATTSLHIYEHHWERAAKLVGAVPQRLEDVRSIPFQLPEDKRYVDYLDDLFYKWFVIEEDIRNGEERSEAAVNDFPEPMLRSWLRVLQWWWSGDRDYLAPLQGTRLEASAQVAVQPKKRNDFVKFVTELHSEKHAAYGDSWKRRGEMLGIMANIARKVDRLGSNATTADESAADTAIDLLVYLAKYRWWLTENLSSPNPQVNGATILRNVHGDPFTTNDLIAKVATLPVAEQRKSVVEVEKELTAQFDELESMIMGHNVSRYKRVDQMLPAAYGLARHLWELEQKK